jgi:hypothetical protein
VSGRDDALTVLREALAWELPASGWAGVGDALSKLAASRDLEADLGYLELAGPFRIATRVGDEPVTPIPAPVRERVNELIHSLTARLEKPDGDG